MKHPFFNTRALPRPAAERLHDTTQNLPPQSMSVCPCCHHPLRTTAIHCPQCGAEKHFGPLRRESLLCAAGGLVVLLALEWVLFPTLIGTLWMFPIALVGLAIGLIFAQFRFAGDRWIRQR